MWNYIKNIFIGTPPFNNGLFVNNLNPFFLQKIYIHHLNQLNNSVRRNDSSSDYVCLQYSGEKACLHCSFDYGGQRLTGVRFHWSQSHCPQTKYIHMTTFEQRLKHF